MILSHVPYTDGNHVLRNYMLSVEPSYIFSGHIHHENYKTHTIWKTGRETLVMKLAHEITVPTCSYRMGEKYMGVGLVVFGKYDMMALLHI